MAEYNKIHCNISIITDSGEDINIRPFVDGSDVTINTSDHFDNKAQSFIDALGPAAFVKKTDSIDDTKGIGDETFMYSVDKISSIKQAVSNLISDCRLEYSGWF